MDDARLGSAIRSLRHARGWRQSDLARRAGVSGSTVRLIEKGNAGRVTAARVRDVAAVVGLALRWDPGPAPQLGRLRDADHAAAADRVARRLLDTRWIVHPEFSYNHYGERGRIDLLAYHPNSGVVLVVEVKTILVDLQDLLGTLDAKWRIAARLAADLGWDAGSVVPALVVVESTTARRRIASHSALLARFTLRGWAALAWLRDPSTAATVPTGVLLSEKLPKRDDHDLRRAGRQRVRVTAPVLSTNLAPRPVSPARNRG